MCWISFPPNGALSCRAGTVGALVWMSPWGGKTLCSVHGQRGRAVADRVVGPGGRASPPWTPGVGPAVIEAPTDLQSLRQVAAAKPGDHRAGERSWSS